MQAQAREAVYWPGIDADTVNYVCQCTICTKHKASPSVQPMLPRDIPNGPWQEITADYLTHKGKEYLLVCDLFSKYSFLYKFSTKSIQSLSMHLLELISQYGPPCMLYTDNGPLFALHDLVQCFQQHCIDHITSSPDFPRSNGFIEHQVCTIKTALSTTQESFKSLEDLLLDLRLTLIGPNVPSPWEILHNRTFKCPSKPSTPVNMECVHNYLVSKCQSQKQAFDRTHGVRELDDLWHSQEMLFLSPTTDQYIPGTILDKATIPYSYTIEAQGKRCCRTREHFRHIHLCNPVNVTPHQ